MIASGLLGNVNITKDRKEPGDVGYGDNVDHGIYLIQLLGGGQKRRSEARDLEKSVSDHDTKSTEPHTIE